MRIIILLARFLLIGLFYATLVTILEVLTGTDIPWWFSSLVGCLTALALCESKNKE